MKTASGAERLLDALAKLGTRRAFLVPGAHIDPLVAAAARHPELSPVICGTEAGAAYMADGYARMAGVPGLCAGVGAPGAGNMITGAVNARIDRSPVCFVTGDVPRHLHGLGGFQDGSADGTRDARLFAAAVDATCSVERAADLPAAVDEVTQRLVTLRRPAHVRVRHEVLSRPAPAVSVDSRPGLAATADGLRSCPGIEALLGTKRVAVLAGERLDGAARAALIELAQRLAWPVATTLAAKGMLAEDHELSLGNFGYAGSNRATRVLLDDEFDALLVIGVDLNERNSLCWDPRLAQPGRRLVLVDSLARGYDGLVGAVRVAAGAGEFIERLADAVDDGPAQADGLRERRAWLAAVAGIPRVFAHPDGWDSPTPLHPGRLVTEMRRLLPRETVLFLDSGAHRLFAGHYWQAYGDGRFHTAATTAPMGWAISAAIGAKLARPDAPIVVLTGDGCMRMQGMELATAKRYGANVVVVVSDNGALGNVYSRQRRDCPEAAEHSVLPPVDWIGFGRALGIDAVRVETAEELREALAQGGRVSGPLLVAARTQASPNLPDLEHAASACTAVPHPNLRGAREREQLG